MCAVSAMFDYAQRNWPVNPPQTQLVPVVWDNEAVKLFKEIIDRLDKLDKKMGDKDCVDPAKATFMAGLDKLNA